MEISKVCGSQDFLQEQITELSISYRLPLKLFNFNLMGVLRLTAESSALLGNTVKCAQICCRGEHR